MDQCMPYAYNNKWTYRFSLTLDASKATKKNKKRSQKRTEARIEKIKQEGVVEQIIAEKDPIKVLKKKLQEAKDNKVLYIRSQPYLWTNKFSFSLPCIIWNPFHMYS